MSQIILSIFQQVYICNFCVNVIEKMDVNDMIF